MTVSTPPAKETHCCSYGITWASLSCPWMTERPIPDPFGGIRTSTGKDPPAVGRSGGCWTTGICRTIEELAKREKVNRGYMSRVLRLTLLAPDIVEAILDGSRRGSW